MRIEYVVGVMVGGGDENYYGDSGDPTHAIIVLDGKGLGRIKKLSRAAAKLKVWRMSEFDYTPVYVIEEEDVKATTTPPPATVIGCIGEGLSYTLGGMSFRESSVRVDGHTRDVESDTVSWSGSIKNTNIHIETCDLHVRELLENQMVLSSRDPLLLLGKRKLEYQSSMTILQFRLKGNLPEAYRFEAGKRI